MRTRSLRCRSWGGSRRGSRRPGPWPGSGREDGYPNIGGRTATRNWARGPASTATTAPREGHDGRPSKLVLRLMIAGVVLLMLMRAQGGPSVHQPDAAPLSDPERVVTSISRTGFSLQYATSKPCETKVEVRQGESLAILNHGAPPDYRVVSGGSGLWHTANVSGLKPGKRYYYRFYDPGAMPTSTETQWGAEAP